MLDKRTEAARDFAASHGYTLVRIGATGELACRCNECQLLLPLRIVEPIAQPNTTRAAFFADHVEHAQTCARIPVI